MQDCRPSHSGRAHFCLSPCLVFSIRLRNQSVADSSGLKFHSTTIIRPLVLASCRIYLSSRRPEPPTRHGTAQARTDDSMRPSFRLSALPPTLRALLADPPLSTSLTVNGWLKSVRAHKNVAFAEVSDGSGGGLQAVWKGKGRADGCVTSKSSRLFALALGRSWSWS